MATVGPAYKANHLTPGIFDKAPKLNALVVVNVDTNILIPTSLIVSSTRSMVLFLGSVLEKASVIMKVSSRPIPTYFEKT